MDFLSDPPPGEGEAEGGSVTIITKERGWAGHFICAHRCRYRRNTLVSDGKNNVVVSSVGLMEKYPDLPGIERSEKKWESIGNERYYETMVFGGKVEGPYIEADVSKQISIPDKLEWGIFGKSDKDLSEDSDLQMDEIHEKIVAWVKKDFRKIVVSK